MAKFIRFTDQDPVRSDADRKTHFVNASQIARLTYDPKRAEVQLTLAGSTKIDHLLRGDDATSALEVIRQL